MFDIVYNGMLSTKAVASAVASIVRRQQKRYYSIRSRVCAKVEELGLQDADYVSLLPPTEAQYISNDACLDAEVFKELWLTHTHILSRLCAAQMADTTYDQVLRMDHSQKFCSKLKNFEADGSSVGIPKTSTQKSGVKFELCRQGSLKPFTPSCESFLIAFSEFKLVCGFWTYSSYSTT
ncbi:hypothetical protein PI124_g22374 [Phytophthora idaei]|nr:hypothetical protein PI124_g22374 [Phytophthora idaei]